MIGKLPHRADHSLRAVLDFDDHPPRFARQLKALLCLLLAADDHVHRLFGQLLVLLDHADDFFGGLAGARGQLADFVGDHGKASRLV